tara:strand:- start:1625 stop:5143 length:3519 start_codon:yes stop_codon:yes gene_type:complete
MPRLVDDQLFGRQPDKRAVDPDLITGGLRSKQFATVVDLLGYGEIEGFRKPTNTNPDTTDSLDLRRDIFLDGTPLVNANGDLNFDDVDVFFRNGTTDQTPLGSIDSFGPDRIENTTSVGVAVTKSTSVSRTITGIQDANGNELIKIIRVTLQLPSLQEFKTDGDIVGTEVSISIRLTENDGTIHDPVVEDVISGKATSPYLKDYEIDLEDPNIQFPLTVTVIRNTDDSTVTTLQNSTNFQLLTTIIPESKAYPGFAYVALRFNAQSFQNFPRRMYRVKGTKIKIPHNGTVDLDNGAISYSGDFDGTFKTEKEWSSDPAWILYDLLTTDKGFGGPDGVVSEDSLDVFSFFTASKYASTIIEDPITGTSEPRFSCNVILNQKNDAYTLINDLCSVMNAMPFYSVGTLQIGQDRPTNTTTNTSDAQYLFTNANVTEDGFNYSGSGQRTKFTEVEVSYFDNDTQKIDYEVVKASDVTALASFPSKYGKTRKTIKAFACTSRGQANRLGRWFLYTNLRETEICTFTTTLEAGVIVRPSMIIGIADSLRAGVRRGGRIKSVSSTTITDPDTGISTDTTAIVVDDANNTDLTTTNSATLSVILSDGTVESRIIHSISDKTITVSSAFSSTPKVNSIWAIENTSIEFQTYRVISIQEKNETEYTITAIIHDFNKYAQVEDTTIAAQPRNITTLLDVKPAPSNLTAIENIVELNNRAVAKIFVSWQPVQGVKEYRVESQYENDSVEVFRVSRPDFELFESRSGTYKFKVQSYNALGVLSTEASSIDNFQASGKTALPADVQNLKVETLSDQLVRLRFDKSTDTDVVHGGNVIVRHSSLTDGTATFSNSVNLIAELAGSVSETILPALDGEYILKFRDDGGRLSSGEASVVVTNPDPKPKLLILSDREDTDSTPFNGTKTACFFSSDLNGLVLGSTVKLDDASVSDFNAIQNFDFLDQNSTTDGGSYEFENILDLGSVHPLRLKRHLVSRGFYPSDFFDERSANIDSWDSFAALVAVSVNAKLTCAVTSAAPSNGSSYQDSDFTGKTFNTFANGTLIGRGFKFKLEMSSSDPAQSIEIDQLGYIAELDRRTEQKSNLSSGTSSSGLAVTFDNAFFTGASGTSVSAGSQLPSIGITANDLGGTDRFEITNISGSGFTIKFQNAGNAVIDKTFSYTAVGFGRGT